MSDQIVPVYDAINHTTNVVVNYDSNKPDTRYAIQAYASKNNEVNASYIDVERFTQYATNFCFTASQIETVNIVMEPKHTPQEQFNVEKHQAEEFKKKQQFVYCNRKLLQRITMETAEQGFKVFMNQYFPDMTLSRLYDQYNNRKLASLIEATYENQTRQIREGIDIENYDAYEDQIKEVIDHIENVKDLIEAYADGGIKRVSVDYDTRLLTKAIIEDVTNNFSNLKSMLNKLPEKLTGQRQQQSVETVDELVSRIYSLTETTKKNNPASAILEEAYLAASFEPTTSLKDKERETLQKTLVRDTVKQFVDILTLHVETQNIMTRYRQRDQQTTETKETIKNLEVCAQMLAAMGALVSQALDIHLFHAVSFSGNIAFMTGITGFLSIYTVLSMPDNPYYKRILHTTTLLSMATVLNNVIDLAVKWGPTVYAANKLNDSINFVTKFFVKTEVNLLPALMSKLTSYARQGVVDLSLINWFRNINAFSVCSASVNLLILNVLLTSMVQGYYALTKEQKYEKTEAGFVLSKDPITTRVYKFIMSEQFQKICEVGFVWFLTSPARHMYGTSLDLVDRATDPTHSMAFGTTNANMEAYFLQTFYMTTFVFTNYGLAPLVRAFTTGNGKFATWLAESYDDDPSTFGRITKTFGKGVALNLLQIPLGKASIAQASDNLINLSVASMYTSMGAILSWASGHFYAAVPNGNYESTQPLGNSSYDILKMVLQPMTRIMQYAAADTANVLIRSYMVGRYDQLMSSMMNGYDPNVEQFPFSHLTYKEMAMFPVYMSFKIDHLKSLFGFWNNQNRAMQISLMILLSNYMKEGPMTQYDWMNTTKAILVYSALASIFRDRQIRGELITVGKTIYNRAVGTFNDSKFFATPLGQAVRRNKYTVMFTGLTAATALAMAYDKATAVQKDSETPEFNKDMSDLMKDVDSRYKGIVNNPRYAHVIHKFFEKVQLIQKTEKGTEDLLRSGRVERFVAPYQEEIQVAWNEVKDLIKIIDKETKLKNDLIKPDTDKSEVYISLYKTYQDAPLNYLNKDRIPDVDEMIRFTKSIAPVQLSFQKRMQTIFSHRNALGPVIKEYIYTGTSFPIILRDLPDLNADNADMFYVDAYILNGFMKTNNVLEPNQFEDYMRRHVFVIDPKSETASKQHLNNRVENLGLNVLDYNIWNLPQINSVHVRAWVKAAKENKITDMIELARDLCKFYSVNTKGVNMRDDEFTEGSIFNPSDVVIQQLFAVGNELAKIAKKATPDEFKLVVKAMKAGLTGEFTSIPSLMGAQSVATKKLTWKETNKQMVRKMDNLITSYVNSYYPFELAKRADEYIKLSITNEENNEQIDNCLFTMALTNNNKVMSKLRYKSYNDFKLHMNTLRYSDVASFYDDLFANKNYLETPINTFYIYFNNIAAMTRDAQEHVGALQTLQQLKEEMKQLEVWIDSATGTSEGSQLVLYSGNNKYSEVKVEILNFQEEQDHVANLIKQSKGNEFAAKKGLISYVAEKQNEYNQLAIRLKQAQDLADLTENSVRKLLAYEAIANQHNPNPGDAVGLIPLRSIITEPSQVPGINVEPTSLIVLSTQPKSPYIDQPPVSFYDTWESSSNINASSVVTTKEQTNVFAQIAMQIKNEDSSLVTTTLSNISNNNLQDKASSTQSLLTEPRQDLFWAYLFFMFAAYELLLTKFGFPSIVKNIARLASKKSSSQRQLSEEEEYIEKRRNVVEDSLEDYQNYFNPTRIDAQYTLLKRPIDENVANYAKYLEQRWSAVTNFLNQQMKTLQLASLDSLQFSYMVSRFATKYANGDPLMHYYCHLSSLMSLEDDKVYEHIKPSTVFRLRSALRNAFKHSDLNNVPELMKTNIKLVRKDPEFLNTPQTKANLIGFDINDVEWLFPLISPVSVFANQRTSVLILNSDISMFGAGSVVTPDELSKPRAMMIGDVEVPVDHTNLNDALIIKFILEQGAKKMETLQTFANYTNAKLTMAMLDTNTF